MILVNRKVYKPERFYAGEFKSDKLEVESIEWIYEKDNISEDIHLLLLLDMMIKNTECGHIVNCDYLPYLRSHHDNNNEFPANELYRYFQNLHFVSSTQIHSEPCNVSYEPEYKKDYIALDKSEYDRRVEASLPISTYFAKERKDGKVVSYLLYYELELNGKPIVLVDDLIGYGTTAQKACEILKAKGYNDITIEVDVAEAVYKQNPYFKENGIEVIYKKLIGE